MTDHQAPAPGSDQELARFAALQAQFVTQYRDIFPDRSRWQTVIVVPSATVDQEVLKTVEGIQHYEERMLYMLMLLRQPRMRLVYVSSQPIDPVIIDYYLHLLPGVPSSHAKQRLTLLSCHDGSSLPLTRKVLGRRLLMERIQRQITDAQATHMACFNVTPLERTLAVRLGIPLFGCDPSLWHWGTKSGGRELFRAAGVACADGAENLKSEADIVEALVNVKRKRPSLKRALVKLNDGISGKGNATFSFNGAPELDAITPWVAQQLPTSLTYEAGEETWDRFLKSFGEMGGVVESFLEADHIRSPSVQGLITPLGEVRLASSHDQVLGGPTGQTYLGCTFPADDAYRKTIHHATEKVGAQLAQRGVWGRFAVDFLATQTGADWDTFAIEINVRKGGTTHPYLMLQFLTDGDYDADTGLFMTPAGQARYYYASDNLHKDSYRGLLPLDLINILVEHGLNFHAATQQGVVFHLIGALSEFGKLGALCVADSPKNAKDLFDHAMSVLDTEAERCALDL